MRQAPQPTPNRRIRGATDSLSLRSRVLLFHLDAPLDFVDSNKLSHCQVVGEGNDAEPQQVGQEISHDLLLE